MPRPGPVTPEAQGGGPGVWSVKAFLVVFLGRNHGDRVTRFRIGWLESFRGLPGCLWLSDPGPGWLGQEIWAPAV